MVRNLAAEVGGARGTLKPLWDGAAGDAFSRVGSAQLCIPGRSPQLWTENRCERMAPFLTLTTPEGREAGGLLQHGGPGMGQ